MDIAPTTAETERHAGMSKASDDVLAERNRQVVSEGWSAEHDDDHDGGGLAEAAVCYASHAAARGFIFDRYPDEYRADRPFPEDRTVFGHGDVTWPKGWAWSWWKPKSPRRDLVRAAALLIAEIERLDRATARSGGAERG